MKISTFITALLFVGVIFFVFALAMNEASEKYGEDIDISSWEDKYDYASDINSSIDPLIEEIDKISNEETGWLEKVGAGFTGLISAVLLLPKLVWSSFEITGGLITNGFTPLNIPQYIITVLIIALTIWGVFKLVEFFQRWQI